MTEQWQELKETITEMRDNGGTGTQQEVCKFLANYMEILEKQMQEPCEDCISREQAKDTMYALCDETETFEDNPWRDNPHIDAIIDGLDDLPSVAPKAEQKTVLDKIKAEIEQKQYDSMDDKDYDEGIRFGLMLAYQTVDKYNAESEG